jgi:hypothetical protein
MTNHYLGESWLDSIDGRIEVATSLVAGLLLTYYRVLPALIQEDVPTPH